MSSHFCDEKRAYFGKYDRFACIKCDVWLEPDHCVGMICDGGFEHSPEKPSMSTYTYEYFDSDDLEKNT